MKQGKSLPELAAQIKRERKATRDFVAPTTELEYICDDDESLGVVEFTAKGDRHRVTPTPYCLRQIGDRAKIPAAYVNRMLGADENGNYPNVQLLADNLNWWWQHTDDNRMLRCHFFNGDKRLRAFLSDRYRPLDNYKLAEVVLPKIAEAGCEVISSEITERRLYIQAATPRMEFDVNAFRRSGKKLSEADPVQAGVIICNSEVGAGALRIEPLLWRLSCLNGLIAAHAVSRYHVGARNQDPAFAELEAAAEYYTDETKRMDDKAFWMKVRDVIDGTFDRGLFETLVEKFASTGEVRIHGVEAVEEVSRQFKLMEHEKASILDHLIEGGDLSVVGLANAITRASSDVESYDRAIDLERIGGRVIELPPETWED